MLTDDQRARNAAFQAEERAIYAVHQTATKHLDRGDALLAALDAAPAIAAYQALMDLYKSAPQSARPCAALGSFATAGLARAYTIQGDFKQATIWLDISVNEYGDSCGVYQAYREREASVIRGVWKAAALPPGAAAATLQGIADQKVTLDVPGVNGDPKWIPWVRDLASKEAALILGANLLNSGRPGAAKPYLAKAERHRKGYTEIRAVLANAYLKRLKATPEPARPR